MFRGSFDSLRSLKMTGKSAINWDLFLDSLCILKGAWGVGRNLAKCKMGKGKNGKKTGKSDPFFSKIGIFRANSLSAPMHFRLFAKWEKNGKIFEQKFGII